MDPDDDYLGIEISAASPRFAGATRIYSGLDELSSLASRIEGFPINPNDDRRYEFGTTEAGFAGGFASLHFQCIDGSGAAALEVVLKDDADLHERASAAFSFPVLAADVDRFVQQLRAIERAQAGKAVLNGAT